MLSSATKHLVRIASFTPSAVSSFDRRVCDDAGALEYYRGKGYFEGWADANELSAMALGERRGRQQGASALSMNLSLGMYDMAVARRFFEPLGAWDRPACPCLPLI